MDCIGCEPAVARKDRPHTFFSHEKHPCPRCSRVDEARVVFRDERVIALLRCGTCGPVEWELAPDATAYRAAFLARGLATALPGEEILFKRTTSTCPGCLALLEADVLIRDGKVYFRK